MNQIRTVVINNKTIRLLLKIVLVYLMVIIVYAMMAFSEPLQRHIGTQHTYLTSLSVVDMGHVRSCQLVRGSLVEIRGCPIAFIIGEGILIPGMFHKVGMILVHLTTHNHSRIGVSPGIYLKAVTFLWIEVGLEDQSAARHIHVQTDHAL